MTARGHCSIAASRCTRERPGPASVGIDAEERSCTPRADHGSHFTVEIEVGTPGRKLDVMANAGSVYAIVALCRCVAAGARSPKDKCCHASPASSTT